MTAVLAAPEIDIAIEIVCAAWLDCCPDTEPMAREAVRLTLDRAVREPVAPNASITVGIRFTDDDEQRQLNRIYRCKDIPTNVLSFSLAEATEPVPPGLPVLLGDVVLAFQTVHREAEEQQKPIADHLRHLVVHGVLHLLGYDHQNDSDAAIMEACEIDILAALGVPDPYRDIM